MVIAHHQDPVAAAEHLAGAGRVAEAIDLLIPLANGLAPSHKLLSVLSVLYKELGRYDAALEVNRKATTLYPESGVAWHNLAVTLGEMGRPAEVRSAAQRAFAAKLDAPETWLVYARALQLLGELDAAETAFRQALQRRPDFLRAAVELGRLVWMRTGDAQAAIAPLDAAQRAGAPETPVILAKGRLLRAAGAEKEERTTLEAALERAPNDVLLLQAVAQAHLETGDVDYGASLAARLEALGPDNVAAKLQHASLLLAQGKAEQALIRARRATELEPHNQATWGWLATAARATGDPMYRWLYDYERLVRSYDLDEVPGWSNQAAWLVDLAATLRRVHPLSFQQPEQSVRGGVQTMIELSTLDDPAIKAFFAAIDSPIRSYISSMGDDPLHPLTQRKTPHYRVSGSWSVLLKPNGYHVDHFHPRGWISSAFYVEVPESALEFETHEGWIRFGQPPFRTVPAMGAEHFVRPARGKLVLFPSYMWHGTVPFTTAESRLTIAFDAVPARVS
jgi:uncharacterized protein (TIGR02466 family)